MERKKVLIVLFAVVVLVGTIGVGIFLLNRNSSGAYPSYETAGKAPNEMAQQGSTTWPLPADAKLPLSNTETITPAASHCSWAIVDQNISTEFLVTSPSGEQTGYLPTGEIVLDIPDSSYGIDGGIQNDINVPPTPKFIYFGMNINNDDDENGIWEVQVQGKQKQPEKYHLDISSVCGPFNDSSFEFDGALATNQTDKYIITFSGGIIQKIDH